MKTSALFALLLAVSVSARALAPNVNRGDVKVSGGAAPASAAKGNAGSAKSGAGAAKKGSAAAKGGKSSAASKSNKGSAASNSNNSNSTSTASVNNNNSTASNDNNNNNNSTASGTSSAASATRTRPCDMGDQSLAGGLAASVLIGIGQQASVVTLQGAANANDFSTGVTRLQQFVDTAGLQLQMAQGIADDGSFAQTQLKLLAASQTAQDTLVKSLAAAGASAASSNDTLTQLAQSFLDSTNNAQDGAEQALIDCFIPINAVSG